MLKRVEALQYRNVPLKVASVPSLLARRRLFNVTSLGVSIFVRVFLNY